MIQKRTQNKMRQKILRKVGQVSVSTAAWKSYGALVLIMDRSLT